MKNLILLVLALLLLFSCSMPDSEYRFVSLSSEPNVVLKIGSDDGNPSVYVFDGREANWYGLPYEDYLCVEVGDTLKNYRITVVRNYYNNNE